MHSKRSYLDTVNAGRQRRPQSAIDDLNRTLDAIGARLERPADAPRYRADDRLRREREPMRDSYQDDMLERDMRQRMSASGRDFAGPATHDLARSIETTRRQEEGLASIGKIAGELKGLREEMRHQMSTGLHHEFESLRADIERAYSTAAASQPGPDLGRKLERLSESIQSLAARGDDRGVELLRHEMDEVRAAMASLAREDTVLSVERRWQDMGRRFDAFEERYAARESSGDPAIDSLNERLEQISDAVNNLPESLSLRSLEDKVRTLASAVDHFSRQQDVTSPSSFALIEERLDEISRAIVASAVSGQPQPLQMEQFERVEARIASLARQIEELSDDRPTGQVIDRINVLSQRVDDLARRADFPEQAVARLAEQIATIAQRIEGGFTAADADPIVRGLEHRFSSLTDMLQKQQGEAAKRGQTIFKELESRLDELAARLELPPQQQGPSGIAIMGAIDARFDEMSQRFAAGGASDGSAFRKLETRLEDISDRLDRSSKQPGVDPALIASLQAQVSGLSNHLSKPGEPLPKFEDMGPRLEKIEQAISGSRDSILDAARKAAEETIRRVGVSSDDPGVAELASDLKALDTLTRRSDERNARTFEAIHDTLLKIVDRLGTLETKGPALGATPRPDVRATLPADRLPALDADPFETIAAEPRPAQRPLPAGKRSPAEAAAAAATAALADPVEAVALTKDETPARRSMLGGLARALTGRREVAAEPSLAGDAPTIEPRLPDVGLDEPLDPKLANRPLEPGSGAPDLNAIVRRVRDERGQTPKSNDADAAKSDFIAAARRAAQAAAAEAETKKVSLDKVAIATKSGIGGIFRNHRKAALMAVGGAVLILAGLQLGRAFLTDEAPVAAMETTGDTAPEASASAPAPGSQMADGEAPRMAATMEADEAAAAADSVPTIMSIPKADAATGSLPEELSMAGPATASVPTMQAPEPTEASDVEAAPAPTSISVPVDAGPVPLREAAEQGDPKAMFEIGARYHEGRGTKADEKTAAKWYEMAADAGFAPAQYRIGNFYEKGVGVERDIKKAKTWYQMAAEQGNASAMHNLAVLLAMGADGTTDNESAGRWFVKAAELGVKDSQFNLAILSAKGVGVPQSLEESYKWFALVAKAGDKDAASKRDEVANALRPEQLKRARAAAELWKPKPVDAEANDAAIPESWMESDSKTASVDMKQAVRNIQLILNKNGYDAGSADGVMGLKTKNAIAAFQTAQGMDATGEVSEELVHALLKMK